MLEKNKKNNEQYFLSENEQVFNLILSLLGLILKPDKAVIY